MKNEFKSYLLSEGKVYLGQRVGDVLDALQSLNDDAPHMGKRHLMRTIQNIVKQIRKILHSNWTYEEEKYLKELQKIGVFLMKGLDDNKELPTVVASASEALQKMSGSISQPINNLAAPAHSEDDIEDNYEAG